MDGWVVAIATPSSHQSGVSQRFLKGKATCLLDWTNDILDKIVSTPYITGIHYYVIMWSHDLLGMYLE